MEQLLNDYGGLLLGGLFMVLMLGMHMKGMGHGDHGPREDAEQAPPPAGSTPKQPATAVARPPAGRESGGCH
jgi:hypothetical protein